MPMPTPTQNESKEDFINRCMGDSVMNEDFPDSSQRRAVCERQWEDSQSSASINYPHLYNAVMDATWAILPAKLSEVVSFIESKAFGTEAEFSRPIIHNNRFRESFTTRDGVAVIPLFGTIVPRLGSIAEISGGTSVQRFQSNFADALSDDSIHSIVIDTDSPGGAVAGTAELGDLIFNARGEKPIIAVANTMMASAAYWIASQADEVISSPSAMVGSIGVLYVHRDESQMMANRGIKTTFISSGKYKAMGNSFEPLGEESESYFQGLVDDQFSDFVAAISRGRGISEKDIRDTFGDGRIFRSHTALELGMVDRVESINSVIDGLAKDSESNNTSPSRLYSRAFSDSDSVNVANVEVIGGHHMSYEENTAENEEPTTTESREGATAEPVVEPSGDLAAQLEAANAALAERDAVIEQLAGRVGSLETENRHKRFTDIVMGRAEGSDGQQWFGDPEKHITMMETLAKHHGEDSDELRAYIEIQSQQAAMISESKAFDTIGHDAPATIYENPRQEFESKIAERRKAAQEQGDEIPYEETVALVASENPDLYRAYTRSVETRI